MPALSYAVADFQAFTKIRSADVNSRFSDIKTLLNTTKLDDVNLQNAGITRATKLKLGTANYIVINDGTGAMSEEAQLSTTRGGLGFTPTLTGNAGKAIIVNTGGTAFTLGTPDVDRLAGQSTNDVATLTAGEAITAQDAVCVGYNQGNGKIFRCNASTNNRRYNFIGFAKSSASVTPQIVTWTFSADLVASNVISWAVNGRPFSRTFATDNNTTVAAIATDIATHPDVNSANVTSNGSHNHVITVTGNGALTINITGSTGTGVPTVTAGASQATVAIATTQSPVGGAVNIHTYGPLAGFSGLVVNAQYYLSTSTGQITQFPSVLPAVKVGTAMSSTVLFVFGGFKNEFIFESANTWIKANGSTTTGSAAATADVEHFDLSAWSTGTTSGLARMGATMGDGNYNAVIIIAGGENTATTDITTVQQYDKVTWSTLAALPAVRVTVGCGNRVGSFTILGGSTDHSGTTPTSTVLTFNGSSWTNAGSLLTAAVSRNAVYSRPVAGVVGTVGGYVTTPTATANHDQWNGTSVSNKTNVPSSGTYSAGSQTISDRGLVMGLLSTTTSYTWDGSSWSTLITMTDTFDDESIAELSPVRGSGFASSNQCSYMNCKSAGGTPNTQSTRFNGASWSAETASNLARTGNSGGMI